MAGASTQELAVLVVGLTIGLYYLILSILKVVIWITGYEEEEPE